jgi:hypothetical protein
MKSWIKNVIRLIVVRAHFFYWVSAVFCHKFFVAENYITLYWVLVVIFFLFMLFEDLRRKKQTTHVTKNG